MLRNDERLFRAVSEATSALVFDQRDLRDYIDAKGDASDAAPKTLTDWHCHGSVELPESRASHFQEGGRRGSSTISIRLFIQARQTPQGVGRAMARGRVASGRADTVREPQRRDAGIEDSDRSAPTGGRGRPGSAA